MQKQAWDTTRFYLEGTYQHLQVKPIRITYANTSYMFTELSRGKLKRKLFEVSLAQMKNN